MTEKQLSKLFCELFEASKTRHRSFGKQCVEAAISFVNAPVPHGRDPVEFRTYRITFAKALHLSYFGYPLPEDGI